MRHGYVTESDKRQRQRQQQQNVVLFRKYRTSRTSLTQFWRPLTFYKSLPLALAHGTGHWLSRFFLCLPGGPALQRP